MRSGCDTTTPCALCTEGNQAKLVVQKMNAMTMPVGQRSPSVWMRWMATTKTGGTAHKASSRFALIAFWPCCCCPQSPERFPELQPMSGLVVREDCDQLVLWLPLRQEPINPQCCQLTARTTIHQSVQPMRQQASGQCGRSRLIPCPHRLVVRTSRCGRDNPGSTPGVDNLNSPRTSLSVQALWNCPLCAQVRRCGFKKEVLPASGRPPKKKGRVRA